MSQAQTIAAALPVQSRLLASTSAEAVSIPWSIWLMVAGMILGAAGGAWDIAWHSSIGRDTVFTPPHFTMWTSAVLIGISSAYAILAATFARASPARDASVQVLGFHAPGGAFFAAWGSVALLAGVPFDKWWHDAYGIDVVLLTPPHLLGFLGSLVATVGAMAWMASIINRSKDALHGRLTWLFLLVGSIFLAELSIVINIPTGLSNMHTAGCYLAAAMFIPSMVIFTGWGSAHKWGCTITCAIYMSIGLAVEWLLPLFPAEPKLGPVYHNVTHLIPLRFPLLLIVPGFVADLLLQRLERRSSWLKAVWVGPAFVLSFLVVQWPFANFLMSPASRNWIFGTAYFAYQDPAGVLYDPYKFHVEKTLGAFVLTMAAALVASIATTRLGLAWGGWMRRVRR
jgi:hypothetical protein